MKIQPFRAFFPNLDLIDSPDAFFASVKESYPALKQQGYFKQRNSPGFYLYQIECFDRRFTGVVALVDIEAYLKGKIKRHEQTIARSEVQQKQLILYRKAMVKPVLLGYPTVGAIQRLTSSVLEEKEPFIDIGFTDGTGVHRLWEINDAVQIARLQGLFAQNVSLSVIADGHHRCSGAALLYGEQKGDARKLYQYLLVGLFPNSELSINSYNRIVTGLNGQSPIQFLERLREICHVTPLATPRKPTQKFEVLMLLRDKWYRLYWREETLASFEESVLLDVNLLNELILRRQLGIRNVRNALRINYLPHQEGFENVLSKMKLSEDGIAFLLPSVKFHEIMYFARAGKVLPPKSTWFEPRIKNGLLVYELY